MTKKLKIRVLNQREIQDNLSGILFLNSLANFGVSNTELRRKCLNQVKNQQNEQIMTNIALKSKNMEKGVKKC